MPVVSVATISRNWPSSLRTTICAGFVESASVLVVTKPWREPVPSSAGPLAAHDKAGVEMTIANERPYLRKCFKFVAVTVFNSLSSRNMNSIGNWFQRKI